MSNGTKIFTSSIARLMLKEMIAGIIEQILTEFFQMHNAQRGVILSASKRKKKKRTINSSRHIRRTIFG